MEIIFSRNYDCYSTKFKIKNEHLWEEMYHKIAFLAESGTDVEYVEKNYEQ